MILRGLRPDEIVQEKTEGPERLDFARVIVAKSLVGDLIETGAIRVQLDAGVLQGFHTFAVYAQRRFALHLSESVDRCFESTFGILASFALQALY